MYYMYGMWKNISRSNRAKDNTEYSLCGNYFTLITEWDDSGAIYRIVYAKDTKVKYFIAKSGYKFGITPLYNADGTVQVYGE